MTDETKPATGEAKTETVETEVKNEAQGAAETELTQERFERMEAALKKANKEAEKYRKEAETFEKAEQAKKEAELTETEKLRKELEATKAQAAKAERDALIQRIAAETGLPAVLAARLQGADEEALREDAKGLLETIKTQPTKQAKTEPTLAAEGAKTETAAERGRRILNPAGNSPFDVEGAKKMGGGVIFGND